MKTFKILMFFLIIVAFTSCNYSSSSKKAETLSKTENISINKPIVKNGDLSDSTIEIKFKDFSVSINRIVVFDDDKKLNETQKDTVYLFSELGETIEGQTISVNIEQISNLKIEQRYETSLTIMGDGPHCDLIDWKHYHSDWKNLETNSTGQFVCKYYSRKERERFPKVQISELKEVVKKHCDEEFYKLVSKIKSPLEYPSSVGISRYFLKLTGLHKKNGHPFTKIIILEVAMGC